jgi:hypothetical protein
MADEPLIDADDFDIHGSPDCSFGDALPAQVLPELKLAEDLPQLSFPDLVARFEAYFDAYPHNADICRAFDDVLNRLDSLQTATSDSLPGMRHPEHPKVRPARLVKGQEPKRIEYNIIVHIAPEQATPDRGARNYTKTSWPRLAIPNPAPSCSLDSVPLNPNLATNY